MHLYPFITAAIAKPIPVFPEVPSIIVPPGFRRPDFSASSIILIAIRSFIEFPGFMDSTFASIVAGTPSVILFNRTRGVLPIVSNILLYHISYYKGENLKFKVFNGQFLLDQLL